MWVLTERVEPESINTFVGQETIVSVDTQTNS